MAMDVQVGGTGQLLARFDDMPATMALRMVDTMHDIVLMLEARIRSRMGQLFQNPGRMQASVSSAVEVGSDTVVGTAGAYDLPYLRIQEFGGVTSPHDILPVNASVLAFFMPGGFVPFKPGAATGDVLFTRIVHHPGSRIPERSYARSALAMERPNIIAMLQAAVDQGARTS